MAFQLKNFQSSVASMINWMKGTQTIITDFNVGAIARTLIEAVAIEIDELYQQMFNGLVESIPVMVYDSFSFNLLAAQNASGIMLLTISAQSTATTIPAGTVFISALNNQSYTTQTSTTLAIGATTANILLVASTAGSIGNIFTVSAFTTSASIAGLLSMVVASGFTNGADIETADARKIRFNQYISTLQRGTLQAFTYALQNQAMIYNTDGSLQEQVAFVSCIEPLMSNVGTAYASGWTNVYIHNGVNGASTALQTLSANILNGYTSGGGSQVSGYKAAGTVIFMYQANVVTVNVVGTVSALSGYTQDGVEAAVQSSITNYLSGLDFNAEMSLNTLQIVAYSTPGVNSFNLISPTSNILIPLSSYPGAKVMPGTVSVCAGYCDAGTISGTTLAVAGNISGVFAVGQTISGTGVTVGTTIVAFTSTNTGTGGAGTYTISTGATVPVGEVIMAF